MNAQQWLVTVSVGMLMGFVGQALRVFVGLKKAKDEAAGKGKNFSEQFEPATLLISLLFGAAAGAVAAITTADPGSNLSSETLFGFAGAGYAGADFLEGVMNKYIPSANVEATPQNSMASQLRQAPSPVPAGAPISAIMSANGDVRPLPPP